MKSTQKQGPQTEDFFGVEESGAKEHLDSRVFAKYSRPAGIYICKAGTTHDIKLQISEMASTTSYSSGTTYKTVNKSRSLFVVL